MKTIILNTSQIDDLSIFEGSIKSFHIDNDTLVIELSYALLPRDILQMCQYLKYDSVVKLTYKRVSFICVSLSGDNSFNLKNGCLHDNDRVLEYSGHWCERFLDVSLVCSSVELVLPD